MAALDIPTDEREILCGFLDWNRVVVEQKARGLDRAGATAVATPSGLTVLSLVRHLTYVEGRWFRHHLLGDPTAPTSDVAGSFTVDPGLTVEAAVEAYREACESSRAAIADRALADVCAIPNEHLGVVTLRYVLAHMINETARHLGHLDVLRELTDGQVGDG